tara:strand:- start:360 stop:872 length:513 start_codon:yes stop_codon:yes gene_type:complete
VSSNQFPRIGHGYDVHAFIPGDFITLGGVKIPHTKAIKAHSDGDVVYHAAMDALLGAAALGDIGHHFPDTNVNFKGASSRDLMLHVYELLKSKKMVPINIDITIIAQRPKMAPHLEQMKKNLSSDLQIPVSHINLKATTTEKLGYIGREEGIAVHAVTLVQENVNENSDK